MAFTRTAFGSNPHTVPTNVSGVNAAHPLAAGLRSLWVPAWSPGSRLRNFAPDLSQKNLELLPVGTAPALRSIPQGQASFHSSDVGWTATTSPYDPSVSLPLTMAFMGSWGGSIANYPSFYGLSNSSLYSAYASIIPYSTNQLGWNLCHNTTATEVLINLGTLVVGQPILVIATMRSATDHEALCLNLHTGVLTTGTSANNQNTVANQIVNREGLGHASFNGAANNYLDGLCAAGMLWNRGFSSKELQEFIVSPWSMVLPRRTGVRTFLIAGGTVHNVTGSDSLATGDATSSSLQTSSSASDSVTASDGSIGLTTVPVIGTDPVTLTDGGVSSLSTVAVASDSLSTSDAASSLLQANPLATDAVTAGENSTGLIVASVAGTDSVTATDGSASSLSIGALASDGLTVSESITVSTVSVGVSTDSVSTGDSGLSSHVMVSVASDSVVTGESLAVTSVLVEGSTETLTASDSGTGTLGSVTYNVSGSDDLLAQDGSSTTLVTAGSASESAALTESVGSSLVRVGEASDVLTASDSATGDLGSVTHNVSASDGATSGDSASTSQVHLESVVDSVLLLDDAVSSLGPVTHSVTASDTSVASDDGASSLVSPVSGTDSLATSDAGIASRLIFKLGSDNIIAVDSSLSVVLWHGVAEESLQASDAANSTAIWFAAGLDSITSLDLAIGYSSSVNPRVPAIPANARSMSPGANSRVRATPAIPRTN